jgi:hypothetical protein
MHSLVLTALLLVITTTAHAKIYRWVDENGTTHYSDKAYTETAKEVEIRETGIDIQKTGEEINQSQVHDSKNKAVEKDVKTVPSPQKVKVKKEVKIVTEEDYRITTSIGKLGADVISISGRISRGPVCDNMLVTATARNENGLSGTITQQTRKPNAFGSITFEGNAKVGGSGDDYSFWDIDKVIIRCNDE